MTSAGYVLLRLPLEVRDLFKEWLMANFPDKHRHVMSLIRQTRDGKDYDSTWGKRMTGDGPYAVLLQQRFEKACERYGLNKSKTVLRTDLFAPPSEPEAQMSLF